MSRKQWVMLSLLLLWGCIVGIVGAVALIDPFEIYHQATAFIPPIENGTQMYSNAGIAKSYAYDSIVIGSSMTENFSPSQMDTQLGGQFVKLPINSGTPRDHSLMMATAFATHDVKRVFYGMDIEALTHFYTSLKGDMPQYLYDDSLFNDVRYWFNSSVLTHYIPKALSTWGQHDSALRDHMYNWGSLYTYGREAALRGLAISSTPVKQTPAQEPPALSQQSHLNIQHNILPYIEEHPDTEFIIFFPPYSLARWYEFYTQGDLYYHLEQKEALTRLLLGYKNVQIYDFQARTDWILDLSNYIDTWHYGPWINDAIVTAVSEERERITDADQVKANNDIIRTLTENLVALGAWPDDVAAFFP